MRGLDYYTRTVFEWVTERLGAQGTICAGGRYDGLVEQLGGKPIAAAGFAMGVERLLELLRELDKTAAPLSPHAYLVMSGESAQQSGFVLAEQLRNDLPPLRLQVNLGGGSFKSQFKKADKSGATLALIIGEDELNSGNTVVKSLRNREKQQQALDYKALVAELKQLL